MSWSVVLLVAMHAWGGTPDLPSESRYYVDGWSWCDVLLLARSQSTDANTARKRLGEAIARGGEEELRRGIGDTRAAVVPDGFSTCPYWEAGFSYDDAELLGSVWGVDVYEAKARIEDALIWRTEDKIWTALHEAKAESAQKQEQFLASGLSFCDAELLAREWGVSAEEARGVIGTKSMTARDPQIRRDLKLARKHHGRDESACAWYDIGYTYEDAEALASLWGVETWEAKARLEAAARKGKESKIRALLGP